MRVGCFILLSVLCTGCRSGGEELLEAQLRAREDRIRNLESQLVEQRSSVRTFQEESRILRAELERPDSVPVSEQIAAGFAVQELQFSSMLTGVLDDNRVHAVVRPTDKDGDIVKLPGQLQLQLVDLSAPEDERTLGKWVWSPGEAEELWSSAAIGTGYVVDLPVSELPTGRKLTLLARFRPGDGRKFDALHELTTPEVSSDVMQVGFDR